MYRCCIRQQPDQCGKTLIHKQVNPGLRQNIVQVPDQGYGGHGVAQTRHLHQNNGTDGVQAKGRRCAPPRNQPKAGDDRYGQ
jgi:hypothetical protein